MVTANNIMKRMLTFKESGFFICKDKYFSNCSDFYFDRLAVDQHWLFVESELVGRLGPRVVFVRSESNAKRYIFRESSR